jgi:hypothetical protein
VFERKTDNQQLLTRNQPCPDDGQIEVDSEYLAGVQFAFSAERIIAWQPLFDLSDSSRGHKSGHRSKSLHLRDHWKAMPIAQRWPTAELDSTVLGKYRILADFFDDPEGHSRVDGVRGYAQHRRFCGIRFRRQGLWDEEALGQASSCEIEFLLEAGEEFTSVYISETSHLGDGGALAVRRMLLYLRYRLLMILTAMH